MAGRPRSSRYSRRSRVVVVGLAVVFLFAGSAAIIGQSADDTPTYRDRIDADADAELCSAVEEMSAAAGPVMTSEALAQQIAERDRLDPDGARAVANDLIDACAAKGYAVGDR